MQWVVQKCLTGSVDLKRVEPPLKATPTRDDRQHRESSERTPISGNGGHQTKFNEDTIRHPERGVRKMFPTVAETLGEVCSCGGELC